MSDEVKFQKTSNSEHVEEHTDLTTILRADGVPNVVLGEFENSCLTNTTDLIRKFGEGSWAVRLVYNDRFGGVLIQQQPGEGNRLHYHPDCDECWVILRGEWEWFIEGEGTKRVSSHDIVLVPKGVKHQITCVGSEPGIRFAITGPDVKHAYVDE